MRTSENIVLVSTNDGIKANESYSKIIVRIFSDKDSLVLQKDSLNLVFPGYYEDENLGQRFTKQQILTPDFVGAFLNSERIVPERRKVLASIMNTIVQNSQNQLQSIKNPFFTDSSLIQPIGEDLDSELQKVGYFRKKDLPKTDTVSSETSSGTGVKPVVTTPVIAPVIIVPVAPGPVQPPKKSDIKTLSYIYSPGKYPIVSLPYKSEIQIEGRVPKDVTGVYVNGYQLK